jgi:hypothetical protein
LDLTVHAFREFSLKQQARMREIFRSAAVELFEPADPAEFGAFSLLRHSSAADFCKKLKARGVNTDARGEFVRFGPDFLNTDEEFHRAARVVAESL